MHCARYTSNLSTWASLALPALMLASAPAAAQSILDPPPAPPEPKTEHTELLFAPNLDITAQLGEDSTRFRLGAMFDVEHQGTVGFAKFNTSLDVSFDGEPSASWTADGLLGAGLSDWTDHGDDGTTLFFIGGAVLPGVGVGPGQGDTDIWAVNLHPGLLVRLAAFGADDKTTEELTVFFGVGYGGYFFDSEWQTQETNDVVEAVIPHLYIDARVGLPGTPVTLGTELDVFGIPDESIFEVLWTIDLQVQLAEHVALVPQVTYQMIDNAEVARVIHGGRLIEVPFREIETVNAKLGLTVSF